MSSTSLLLGTWAVLLPGIMAAPNAQGPQAVGVAHGQAWPPHEGGQSSRARYYRGRPLYAVNGTNTTISLPPSTASQIDFSTGASAAPTLTSVAECQADDDYTSTTTIEVTVYITESQEEQSSTESAVISATIEVPYPVNATTTRAPVYGQETDRGTGAVYPGITATGGASRPYYPGNPVYSNSTTTSASTSTLSGSPDLTNTTSSSTALFYNTTTASVTTEDVYRETLAPIYNVTTTSQAPKSTEECVIDTAIAPVTTATLTAILTESIAPTATVTDCDVATGKPQPQTRHCGVHGLPVGNYFIARFVENAPGVPVTLEGCYQFCDSVMEATEGCRSYRFYPERGLNVPRCDLYGSPVAYALDRIDESHVDIWFDLECGSPRSDRWAGLPGLERLAEIGLE